MSCEWRDRVAELEDGPEVEAHLAACEDCARLEAGLVRDLADLRAAHQEPLGASHYTVLRARVMGEVALRRRRAVWRWVWLGTAASAAVLALLLAAPRARREERVLLPVALAPPPAPIPALPVRSKPVRRRRPAVVPMQPLLVKMLTDDPNIVIYWIGETRGE